jgi:hypothetical protein
MQLAEIAPHSFNTILDGSKKLWPEQHEQQNTTLNLQWVSKVNAGDAPRDVVYTIPTHKGWHVVKTRENGRWAQFWFACIDVCTEGLKGSQEECLQKVVRVICGCLEFPVEHEMKNHKKNTAYASTEGFCRWFRVIAEVDQVVR